MALRRVLGKAQREVLKSLASSRMGWSDEGRNGWVWDTPSGTARVLDSLIPYDYVSVEQVYSDGGPHLVWTITKKGLDHVRFLRANRL